MPPKLPRARRARSGPVPGSLEHFQREVVACTRELNRRIPVLGHTYSAAVLVVSLVLQLEAALKATLTAGEMTRREANALLDRLQRAVAAC
jgi:hypothetical protein